MIKVYRNLLNNDGHSVSSEGNMKNHLDDPGNFKTDISNTAPHIAHQGDTVSLPGYPKDDFKIIIFLVAGSLYCTVCVSYFDTSSV